MIASQNRRKLIDLSEPVFASLSKQARREGVSLKKHIERLLEAEALRHRPDIPVGVTDKRIINLVGIAKMPEVGITSGDDRLEYILSK